MTLQSFLIGNHGDNQASKNIRDQKENKRTNSPYDDVSRLSLRYIDTKIDRDRYLRFLIRKINK